MPMGEFFNSVRKSFLCCHCLYIYFQSLSLGVGGEAVMFSSWNNTHQLKFFLSLSHNHTWMMPFWVSLTQVLGWMHRVLCCFLCQSHPHFVTHYVFLWEAPGKKQDPLQFLGTLLLEYSGCAGFDRDFDSSLFLHSAHLSSEQHGKSSFTLLQPKPGIPWEGRDKRISGAYLLANLGESVSTR